MLNLSPKRQLLLLFSFYCFSIGFGSFFSIQLLKFTSSGLTKFSLVVISVFGFLLPAYIAYSTFSQDKLISYWKLDIGFTRKSFLLSVLIMGCCIILMNWLAEVNTRVPLFDWMKQEEASASSKFQQFVKMASWQQLLLNLAVFSFIPAFCEEVFFRGTMQPLWYKCLPKPWMAVFITAFLFSLLHFQFIGFLPRFLAGVVFGGIFYLTGSLWLSITSHILYNSSVIMLNYVDQHGQVDVISLGKMLLNPLLLFTAALGMVLSFFQMRKVRVNKYPYNGN